MTDCVALDARIGAYLAGRLAPDEAEAIEAHAASCDRCAELLEARTRLTVALPRELPPPIATRTATLRRAAIATRRRRTRRVVLPAAIAASLLVAWGVTRRADKAAVMRSREALSPLPMAESRAFAEFEALATARREVEEAVAQASPEARQRLEAQRDRLARQYDQLVALVQAFES